LNKLAFGKSEVFRPMPFKRFLQYFSFKDREFRNSLKKIIGFDPIQLELYQLAFTHRSAAKNQKGGIKNSNERLEFLGDAVLSAIVAEIVFLQFPNEDEGYLTEMRSKLVNRAHLNQVSDKLGLLGFLQFDSKVFPRIGPSGSLLGDAFEALIGAIYLDKGFRTAFNFYKGKVFDPFIEIDELSTSQINYKSKLIEWGQRNGKDIIFETLLSALESPSKVFEIRVLVAGQEFGFGKDFTKKNAEKKAAENACHLLKI